MFQRLLIACVLLSPAALPGLEIVESLYRGSCVVTGQENLAERARGFRQALQQVVVKVTGDIRLREDPRIHTLWPEFEQLVIDFNYEDRKKGIQVSDEQGTRDRSFDLIVNFDPARIDAGITALGGNPWPAPRPSLLVLLEIQDSLGSYLLGQESERGFGQREALSATAQILGVPLVLPHMDLPERLAIGSEEAVEGNASWQTMRKNYPADSLLMGRMVSTDKGYWNTKWRLGAGDEAHDWRIEGVTFDRAIDDGLGRSVQLLAGLE